MMLAGIPVRPELVHELAGLVDELTASTLNHALEIGTVVLALTIRDRERILRGVPLREHEWRVREGLV